MRIDFSLIRRRVRKAVDVLDSTVIIPRWDTYSPNFFYFAGMDVDHSIAVLHRSGGITIISNKLNETLVRENYSRIASVAFFDKKMTAKKVLQKACKGEKCSLDVGTISYGAYRRIRSSWMRPIAKELLSVREVKEKGEIAVMREANRKARKILGRIAKEGVKGKSEKALKAEILVGIAKYGCKEAFDTIAANSRNARFPHYTTAGEGKINDYALVDMGIRYRNYNSDITRCIGDLAEMEDTYGNLRRTSLEVADAAVAGKNILDFVEEVGMILKRNRLREFPHGIGHGIGLEVHEFPHFHAKSRDTLKENSVITIEPGQYGKKGLRYEDMYVIGKKGAKLL